MKDIYEANVLSSMNTKECEMIAVHIEKINMVNIVIYRPPATEMAEFDPILEKLKSILERMEIPNLSLVLSGDFNFPSVEWTPEPSNRCR